MNNKKNIKFIIPSTITVFRIILTFQLIYILKNNFTNVMEFICINILIFASDVIDGRLARYLKAVTGIGEMLDIIADIFYVLLITYLMVFKNLIPCYYIYLVTAEFVIFMITSKYLKNRKTYVAFDMFGRWLAVIYYIVPSIIYITNVINGQLYYFLYTKGFMAIGILTVCVIAYRVLLSCINYKESKLIIVKETHYENRNCL